MKTYFVEIRHTVIERFRIKSPDEKEAREVAKSGHAKPTEVVKAGKRITCSWPLSSEAAGE